MSKSSRAFVGLDQGDEFSHLTILDEEGDLIEFPVAPIRGKVHLASCPRFQDHTDTCRVATHQTSTSWLCL